MACTSSKPWRTLMHDIFSHTCSMRGVLQEHSLTEHLCCSLFLQVLVVVVNNLSRLDAAEKEAFETVSPPESFELLPVKASHM